MDHTALGDLMDLRVRMVILVATAQLTAEFRRSSLLLCLTSTVWAVSIQTAANPQVPEPEAPVNGPLQAADIDSQSGKKRNIYVI